MASLITIGVAKSHLRITTVTTSPLSTEDQEIERKAEQATDIILSYLKGRPVPVSSITAAGGIATVTTPYPHGLATSAVVSVRGSYDAEYNGSFVITSTGTTTFTFPIATTAAATATGPFAISAAQEWDETTVPWRVQAAILRMLTRLWEQRGDDPDDEKADEAAWKTVERLLARDRDPAMA